VLLEAGPATGRYIEQAVIGRGGMGEVVLCIDRNTRRQVALKRILPHAAEDPARRARFVEEAQVTAQLEHPNIVPVHELERAPDGTIYFTMKLVRGKSLAGILADLKAARPHAPRSSPARPYAPRGDDQSDAPRPPAPPLAFPPAGSESRGRVSRGYPPAGEETRGRNDAAAPSLGDLLQVFLKVCDGVAFAHSHGVIHRDLKPANIMVGDYGEVLVMDWGLAKLLPPEGSNTFGRVKAPSPAAKPRDYPPEGIGTFGRENVVSDRHDEGILRTLDGSTIGTPAYMSPEQANGELDKIDQRSDIYSLGAILYEVLTLGRAVEGETPMMVLANAARNRIVPIEKRAAGRYVPRELAAIAMKCLAKSRAARYRSVLDLRRDIALFLEGRSVSARPDSFAQSVVKLVKRNQGISGAIAAAALVLIAVTVGFLINLKGQRDVALRDRRAAQLSEQNAVASDQQRQATALAASRRQTEAAVRAASEGRLDEAAVRAQAAVEVMPDGPWGHYALGVVASERKDYPAARAHLDAALRLDPAHAPSRLLHASVLAMTGDLAKWETLVAEADRSTDWKALAAAGDALYAAERHAASAKAYQKALALMERDSAIAASVRADLKDKAERVTACLKMRGTLAATRNLPVEEQARRIEATLKEIYGLGSCAVEQGLISGIDLGGGADRVRWLDPLKGIPLKSLACHYTRVGDLGPLKGMPLTNLQCWNNGGISDYSPLVGMPLTKLGCGSNPILKDLSFLKGMRLKELYCGWSQVSDLEPLRGMPLKKLSCGVSAVRDLTPLLGMPLKELGCGSTRVSDLGPVRGLPLELLDCGYTVVTDLGPLKGMTLKSLNIEATAVNDLTPLRGMRLEDLVLPPKKQLTPESLQVVQELEKQGCKIVWR
jgi:serine/threonine protein kinase